MELSLYPVWIIDAVGSVGMMLFASLSMREALILHNRDQEDAICIYLMWLVAALFAFCVFRSLGHLVQHLLVFSGNAAVWAELAPLSGGLNTVTFIVIFAVTLFFRNVLVMMNRMTSDRLKIESTSRQLMTLNQNIESVVSDRAKAEMGLKLAHEVRNPVMIIAGLFRRLSFTDSDEKNEQHWKYCKEIERQIAQLEALVASFENMQSSSMESFTALELNAMLSDAVDMVRSETERKGVDLILEQSTGKLPFLGHQQYLNVALAHLLNNSIEACGPGNHIKITIEQTNQGGLATIRDDGAGIPRKVLEHIFEPFYSTREGATGLGLPYVRLIINEHRGEININSVPGRGTTVKLLFPSHLTELQETDKGDK